MFAWLGVKVASIGAGERHPNGHGRFEWIIALLASSSIIVVGWELLQESVGAIRKPKAQVFSIFTIIALAISIGIKLVMFVYNRKKSEEENSASLKVVSVDRLSDAVSTFVVLLALIVNKFWALNIDGFCGIMVALLIMYNGFSSFCETAERIMGVSASMADITNLKEFAMENSDFSDIADIQIEDYGFGRFRASMIAIEKKGITAERLLSDTADLKYRIYERFGYHAQVSLESYGIEDDSIREFIECVIEYCSVPLTIQSLRINDACEYSSCSWN